MAKFRAQAITAAVMLVVGVALVVWTLVDDLGMRWGVIGSVLIGFTAVETYVTLLDHEQRGPIRAWLYLLTPMLSGGIFAAAVIQERPDPVPGAVLAEGGEERWSRRIPYVDVFRRFGDLLVYESDGYTAALEITSGKDRYLGIRDEESYRRLTIVAVRSGEVVRTEPFAFQRDPFAVAGDFLYTADSDGARAISLVDDGPPRPVVMRPHDNSDDFEEPDRLFESRYPGFIGAMPGAWRFPGKSGVTVDRNATGVPAFPVVSASGEQGVWFAGSSRVVSIENAYEEILAHAYDDGTYLQLVADRDAVGTRVHRLDVVRGHTVTSYTVLVEKDAEPTLSLRNGLACVVGECRRLER